ncbi:hypothetical protein OQJ18_14590 [Fluoribacter dumoffii]|uniref:Uncharacterized protein n=1 Tax=Fluoribacter dumoffii TaxID=463 RepID=A0A377GD63_9GAMM|nr:hypothetical protein [Fluoribacter dumoffii]KTC91060.1 hypothetical protein Ldum_2128 [Fluoribacter dumoffii NY 23]MCW8387771.1 hypothetical protein [Fluoribacter dumoffii]MCW8416671.1 hypothetical protein [Fluoribacter dumoffii]MCW8455489.1 hypothetical protein [Fluoribacter dumoffii]MCW8460432.1 hypothetical protein [Fluoribacter dumoffii]
MKKLINSVALSRPFILAAMPASSALLSALEHLALRSDALIVNNLLPNAGTKIRPVGQTSLLTWRTPLSSLVIFNFIC